MGELAVLCTVLRLSRNMPVWQMPVLCQAHPVEMPCMHATLRVLLHFKPSGVARALWTLPTFEEL